MPLLVAGGILLVKGTLVGSRSGERVNHGFMGIVWVRGKRQWWILW